VCRPYLTLLKSALGDRKPVTAPKFFHGLFPRNATDRDAIFEWMAYSYEVNAKTPFSDHAHLIKALQDQHFKRLDGTPVADADIDTWVDRSLQLTPTSKHVVTVVLPVLIVPAMGTISALAKFNGQCRSERDTYTYQATSGVPVPQNQTALKTALQQVDNLKPTHPYPIFRRLLFATFDDFFNGKDWVQQRNGDWIGTHFIYTLVIPIMKIEMPPPPPPAPPPTPVAPNELIFNFYPPIGGGAPTMHFLEDNPTFFGKV
jgi:hypothetical protein